jgi:galactokinase
VHTQAPGRVNLIGEHTDYNGGFVLPCAIARATRVSVQRRADRGVTFLSEGRAPARFDLDALPRQPSHDWRDYARGVLLELRAAGLPLCGADLEIAGDVPIGAGLSSSASFEIATALAMLAICNAAMEPLELAKLAQRAEIRHAGMRCGIMDQFAVTFGSAGHALFLDTRTLEFEAIPVPRGAAIVICNTMIKHKLAAGEYNARRRECERAVALLQQRYPEIRELRDVSEEQLLDARDLLDATAFQRALHVVTENDRVVRAADALRENDLEGFGALMNASHESLRSRYEVSCEELDIMVDLAREIPGVFGARMTGGGFGGCTVNLVESARISKFRESIARSYEALTGIRPEIYDGTPSAGASIQP